MYHKVQAGPPRAGSGSKGKKIPPPSRVYQQEKKQGNKVDSAVRKMAAGRINRQHNKPLPNYIWYYRERQTLQ
jgi:hypothetical protein